MRHTAATLWLASGEAPEWIARQLGHSSTEMLFRVYSRYVPNLTRRDGSAMDRLLSQHRDMASINQVTANRRLLPGAMAMGNEHWTLA
jgi:integrase